MLFLLLLFIFNSLMAAPSAMLQDITLTLPKEPKTIADKPKKPKPDLRIELLRFRHQQCSQMCLEEIGGMHELVVAVGLKEAFILGPELLVDRVQKSSQRGDVDQAIKDMERLVLLLRKVKGLDFPYKLNPRSVELPLKLALESYGGILGSLVEAGPMLFETRSITLEKLINILNMGCELGVYGPEFVSHKIEQYKALASRD